MDVKMQNAYVEVVLENLMSVIKQNLMFQTQLQLSGNTLNENNDLRNQLEDLKKRNLELQSLVDSLNKNNNELKTVANKKTEDENFVENLKKDKIRIQTALNDMMREMKSVKSELETKNKELETNNKYIELLENTLPTSKLKKIKVSRKNNRNEFYRRKFG